MSYLRAAVFISLVLVIGFCIAAGQDASDPIGNVGAGSKVVVGQHPITIPANEDVVYFQNGVLTSYHDVDRDSPNCRLHVQSKPTVRQLNPGREFIVTGARFGNGSTAYVNGFDFKNDPTVDQLQCSVGKQGQNMSIQELKNQMGDLFKLILATPTQS